MNAEEDIKKVLNYLEYISGITPSEQKCYLNPEDSRLGFINDNPINLMMIMSKLADRGSIKLLMEPGDLMPGSRPGSKDKSSLYVFKLLAPDGKLEPPPDKVTSAPGATTVTFDQQNSTLVMGDMKCPIPDESLMYYTCKLVFQGRTRQAKSTDIIDAAKKGENSKRPIQDVCIRLNKLAKDHLNTDKLFVFRADTVRLRKPY